jgi:hypothetical protein
VQLVVLLAELYVAFGIMFIGFGYMVMGKIGGQRAAWFYFGRSLRWSLRSLRFVFAASLAFVWRTLRSLARRLWWALRARLAPRRPQATPTRR